jgi:hypothetical protein
MIGVSEIIFILFVPVFVFVIVFWLWMLIDCLKRQDDMFKFGGNNAKLIWILVIIFTGLIGAAIYYFLIKITDSRQDLLIGVALLASAAIVIILILSLFTVNTKTISSIEPYLSRIPDNLTEEEIPGVKVPDNLTEDQMLAVNIAMDNKTVQETLRGKEVKIGSVSMVSGDSMENGKEIFWNLPGVQIYIGNKDWTSIVEIIPLVDLKGKRVVHILKNSFIKPALPMNLSEDDRNMAIKIALADSQVKEEIGGRDYEIVEVVDYENWMTGKRVGPMQVLIHVNGTGKVYPVTVNLTENKVIEVGEYAWQEK